MADPDESEVEGLTEVAVPANIEQEDLIRHVRVLYALEDLDPFRERALVLGGGRHALFVGEPLADGSLEFYGESVLRLLRSGAGAPVCNGSGCCLMGQFTYTMVCHTSNFDINQHIPQA